MGAAVTTGVLVGGALYHKETSGNQSTTTITNPQGQKTIQVERTDARTGVKTTEITHHDGVRSNIVHDPNKNVTRTEVTRPNGSTSRIIENQQTGFKSIATDRRDATGAIRTTTRETHVDRNNPQNITRITKHPDGSQTKRETSGVVTQTSPNGSRVIRTTPDGHGGITKTTTYRNGGTSTTTRTVGPNGNVTVTKNVHVQGRPVVTREYHHHHYHYGGYSYYAYSPFWGPAYYPWGWYYSPFLAPVYYPPYVWGWGWWYPHWSWYFAPYPVYSQPSYWVTDYVISDYIAERQSAVSADDAARAADLSAQRAQLSADQAQKAKEEAEKAQAAAQITQPIKDQIAEQVKQGMTDIKEKKTTQVVATLNTKTIFVVHEEIEATMHNDENEVCGLSEGDLVRVSELPKEGEQHVVMRVLTAGKDSCKAGSQVHVALSKVQEMHNEFMERVERGMKEAEERKIGGDRPQ